MNCIIEMASGAHLGPVPPCQGAVRSAMFVNDKPVNVWTLTFQTPEALFDFIVSNPYLTIDRSEQGAVIVIEDIDECGLDDYEDVELVLSNNN